MPPLPQFATRGLPVAAAVIVCAMPASVVVTHEGLARLEAELAELKASGRLRIADQLREAVDGGSELTENAAYLEAKEEQARLEHRIATLEDRLERAEVAECVPSPDGPIGIGATVRVRDLHAKRTERYEIVGSGEGDPAQGRVSVDAPLAGALLGHREGEVVELRTALSAAR